MKIEKIEIKGLFGKKDISWELNPQVNVLVGVNGSGKSTILSIVYSILDINPNEKNMNLFNEAHLILDNQEKASYIPFELFLKKYNNMDANINLPILNIRDIQSIQDFGDHVGIKLNIPAKVIETDIEKFVENLNFDLIEANTNNIHANQNLDLRTRPNINPLDIEIQDTIDELNKLNNPELMNQLSGSLNVFFNQIGKHVSYENNELVCTDTQLQQKLNYSHLSSGERQLIYILLRVALSNGDKSKTAIILMDEPEISLHLDWQEHFIKQLTILNPDAQFIIVTHSPALIMNGWNDVYVDMEEITTWQ